MRLNIDIDGLDRLDDTFDGISSRTSNMRPALEAVGDDFRSVMTGVFASGGAAVGGWPRLSRKYAARKARQRPTAPPGVFTGVLRESLTRKGARYARQRIEQNAIVVGTKAPHAHLFRDGRRRQRPRRLIPRRTTLQRRWTPIIAAHVAGRDTRRFTGVV